MTRLRVATYNVHKCKGVDWRVSARRVADVLQEIDAGIIAVQEILQSQAEAISRQTGLPFLLGAAREHNGEPYGNAVFTPLPVVSSKLYDLGIPRREPRACLRASVAMPHHGKALHFFAVHLGTSFLERREQARRFVSPDILEHPAVKGSRIVAGDFNEWTRGLATRLLNEHLQSADVTLHLKRRNTYPGVLPFLHLDHIYYDPAFRLRDMTPHRSRLALLASDHLPLVATFESAESVSNGQ